MDIAHLFIPADQPHKLEKISSCGSDVVILDLEDGVAKEQKTTAREILSSLLTADRNRSEGPRLWVRCNGVTTSHFSADADLLREICPEGILISKCESAAQICEVAAAVPQGVLIPLLESAAGVSEIKAIARASERIARVAFGAVDFALDLGVDWSEEGEERRFAMGQIVLESRAAGLPSPLDAVFPRLDDEAAFVRDAIRGKQMGFFGKMLVHPREIEWLQRVYATDPEKIRWARRVLEAFNQAGASAVSLDGQLIDLPVAEQARRILRAAGENPYLP